MTAIRSIRGMHDILPPDTPLWHWLETRLRALFVAYDFHEIRIPVVEKTELFTRAIGQSTDVVEKEMYAFEDRNGESLCLRPEGTAGAVRAAIQHSLLQTPGLKVWYQGPMFRHERPQKGRQRQFHQFGAEVFGLDGPETDVELINLGWRAWRRLGIDTGIRLEINSLGDREDRERYRTRLLSYLEPYRGDLDADSQRRLKTNPLRIFDSKVETTQKIMDGAPRLADDLGAPARDHFEAVLGLLDELGVAYSVNPGLVRGLDYYGRTVFEWITEALGAQGTVCAGGRYDDLVEIQGGKATPAAGFALGVERLLDLIRLAGTERVQVPHVYVVSSVAPAERLRLSEALRDRDESLRVAMDLAAGSFKAQFRRADRSGARFALVLGDSELADGRITVKDLRGGLEQKSVTREELSNYLAAVLSTGAAG